MQVTTIVNNVSAIDAAIAKYHALLEAADKAEQDIILAVQEYGAAPPRSDRSKRIEGIEWQATVSQRMTSTLNQNYIPKFQARCVKDGKLRLFKNIFRIETRFVLADNAQAAIASIPGTLRKAFIGCRSTNIANPSLKIERRKSVAA